MERYSDPRFNSQYMRPSSGYTYGGREEKGRMPVTNPRRDIEMQNMANVQSKPEIPPGAEDYSIGSNPGPAKTATVWSVGAMVLAGIAMLTILVFIVWFFASKQDEKGSTRSVKDVINGEIDTSPTVQNLTVQKDTVLGDSGADSLTVNSKVASDLIPQGDGTKDLGSSDNGWGDVYIDSLVYDNGASIIQGSDDVILVTEQGLGYRKPVKTYVVDGISGGSGNDYLTQSESGYTILLEEGDNSYSHSIILPVSTGSGIFYQVLFGTSCASNGESSFWIGSDQSSTDYLEGFLTISADNTPTVDGSATYTIHQEDESNAVFIDHITPVPSSLGFNPGVRAGSYINFTDYKPGGWAVEGRLLTAFGPSAGNFNDPFSI